MAEKPFQRFRRFLAELKRRNVYQVAATYAVVGFVLIQLADLTFVRLGLPSWTVTLVIVLVAMGFPLALVLAWAFERTPEGMQRTLPGETAESEEVGAFAGIETGYKVLVGLGLIVAAIAGGWYLTGGGGQSPEVSDRSVAVLPFEALGQEQPGTFTEGMHSDLQTKLSNIAGLTVTSSRSVEQYRGSDESTATVAREMGVGWIVSGDVQRMSDQIQVTVRLVDPKTDTQTWTDSYRRALTADNLFAIQTDITKKVARALEAELSPEESDRIERQPTPSLEAHRLYVQGRQLTLSRQPDSLRLAIELFERAIEEDSSYALAWAGLSDARILHENYSATPEPRSDSLAAALPEAEFAARRALQLDPDLAEAHASLGYVHLLQQNGPVALRQLQRAVELKPSYAQAHHWLATLLLYLGRTDSGRRHLDRAFELNPQLFQGVIARGEEGETDLRAPTHIRLPHMMELYRDQNWEKLGELARLNVSEGEERAFLARFYLTRIEVLKGDTARARRWLSQIDRSPASSRRYLAKGLGHAALGEDSAAFAVWHKIDTTAVSPMQTLIFRGILSFSDILDPLREDPRYRELLYTVNRAWGLNPDGSLPDSVELEFASDEEPDG